MNESNAVAEREAITLSFISWNIGGLHTNNYTQRMDEANQLLKRIGADVIFVQEVVKRDGIASIEPLVDAYDIYYSNSDATYFNAVLLRKGAFTNQTHNIIPYGNSTQRRTVQVIEATFKNTSVFLLNTHLESLGESTKIRCDQFKECMEKMNQIITQNPNAVVIFGGDLNVREKEVSKLPVGISDAWIAAGSDKLHRFTWDTTVNKNLGGNFVVTARYDRIYFGGPLQIDRFELKGKDLVPRQNFYPSDHWAIYCEFSSP